MTEKNPKECARFLKALADGVRLRIVECLFSGERSVTEIADKIGKNHSQVSHHLGVLRNSGLVVDKREGKFVMYKIHPNLYKNIESGKYKYILDFNCCSIGFNEKRNINYP